MRERLEDLVATIKGVALSSAICLAVWCVIASQPIQTTFR